MTKPRALGKTESVFGGKFWYGGPARQGIAILEPLDQIAIAAAG